MVEMNPDPTAGGNRKQPDDGRDAEGRLPEPLDAAHWPPVEGGPAIVLPGMALGQPAGTGPVVSTPLDDAEVPDVEDSAAAQRAAPPAPTEDGPPPGLRTDTGAPGVPGKPAKMATTTAKK